MRHLKSKWASGDLPGEDCRYEPDFAALKSEVTALRPNGEQIFSLAAELLNRSADLRLCAYAMLGAALLSSAEDFVEAFDCFAYLYVEKSSKSYPPGERARSAIWEWCVKSTIHFHLVQHEIELSNEGLQRVERALSALHELTVEQSENPVKWVSLNEWVIEQKKSRSITKKIIEKVMPGDKSPAPETVVAPVDYDSKNFKRYFDKHIIELIKEEQYERAIDCARAYRWSEHIINDEPNLKLDSMISPEQQKLIDMRLNGKKWKDLLLISEELFLKSNLQYCLKLSYLSYTALCGLKAKAAANKLVMHVKELQKNYRHIQSIMYNAGQVGCDEATASWLNQQKQTHQPLLASQTCGYAQCLELLANQEVEKMKAWLQTQTIKTRRDQFWQDYLSIKCIGIEQPKAQLTPLWESLITNSSKEALYAWDLSLTELIWRDYYSFLKQAKLSQETEKFMAIMASCHLPLATNIMRE